MLRVTTIYLIACMSLASACSSGPKPAPADPGANASTETPNETKSEPPAEPAKPEISPEEAERQKLMARIAETQAKIEAGAAKEAERWTDELHAQAKKLAESKERDPKKLLRAIVASPHRVPGNSDRDASRHPVETLMFFGIKREMTVVEAGAGAGWYTEILAPFLAKKGKLLVVANDPDGPRDQMGFLYGLRAKAFMDNAPELYANAELVPINPPESMSFGPAGSADMVLVFREMHNWYRSGNWDKYMAAAHEVLKPGGVLAVVQHRGTPDMDPAESASSGYLSEDWVIGAVEAAGFKLKAKSEINANAKDTKDHPGGVWALPPVLRQGDTDKDKYMEIGESDRMTLKFVKKR